MARRIIISDLHCDTWTNRKFGPRNKTTMEYFLEFLDAVEAAEPKVDEFIINGDIMDLPPYDKNKITAFWRDNCTPKDVVTRLMQLGSKIPITYIYGNHDIGIAGFRCYRGCNVAALGESAFCYPNYSFKQGDALILIEHGHLQDPALGQYTKDLGQHLMDPDFLARYGWAMQRRDLEDPSKQPKPGAMDPIKVKPGKNAHDAAISVYMEQIGAKPESFSVAEALNMLKDHVISALDSPTAPARSLMWLVKAHQAMGSFINGQKGKLPCRAKRLCLIYGHVHATVPKVTIPIRGIDCTYMNSGTWTQGGGSGSYLDIDAKGEVWLQNWISEKDEDKRLRKGD